MKVTLTEELETLVKEKVRSGRDADESDVMRDAPNGKAAELLKVLCPRMFCTGAAKCGIFFTK